MRHPWEICTVTRLPSAVNARWSASTSRTRKITRPHHWGETEQTKLQPCPRRGGLVYNFSRLGNQNGRKGYAKISPRSSRLAPLYPLCIFPTNRAPDRLTRDHSRPLRVQFRHL